MAISAIWWKLGGRPQAISKFVRSSIRKNPGGRFCYKREPLRAGYLAADGAPRVREKCRGAFPRLGYERTTDSDCSLQAPSVHEALAFDLLITGLGSPGQTDVDLLRDVCVRIYKCADCRL